MESSLLNSSDLNSSERIGLKHTRIRRRGFLKAVGSAAVGASLLVTHNASSREKKDHLLDACVPSGIKLPGKLGDPNQNLLSDGRLDPRILEALSVLPNTPTSRPPPALTLSSSYEDCLTWVGYMEEFLEYQHPQQIDTMPLFPDVSSYQETITGFDQNKIKLYIDKPKKLNARLPSIVHIHGGGMCFSSANSPLTQRWRKSLARRGALVIGVEFRNSGGKLGNYPFPSGLNDCASAVRWAYKNRSALDVSHVVVLGESGGGNLAIATGIKAMHEGWSDAISGVYAMAPMILGVYEEAPNSLMSWRENLGYQGNVEMMRAMTLVYDPELKHESAATAWPFNAKMTDLRGLPPHMIVNYELDLIRDDGAVFCRKLQASGVSATSRMIYGAHHVPEIAMPDVIPELTRDTISSISAFTSGVGG